MKAWHKCSWIRNQESTEQESAVASQFTSSSVDFLEFGVDLQRCPLGCDIGKGRPFSLLSELRSIPMLTIRVWRGGFGTHIFGFVHVAIGGRAFGCRGDTSGTKLSKCSVCFVSSVYSRRQEGELSFIMKTAITTCFIPYLRIRNILLLHNMNEASNNNTKVTYYIISKSVKYII